MSYLLGPLDCIMPLLFNIIFNLPVPATVTPLTMLVTAATIFFFCYTSVVVLCCLQLFCFLDLLFYYNVYFIKDKMVKLYFTMENANEVTLLLFLGAAY